MSKPESIIMFKGKMDSVSFYKKEGANLERNANALSRFMKWITRERPKIDRIAFLWLIKRFVDEDAEFFYVPFEDVKKSVEVMGAIPFDVPDVEYTHYGDECTFDYIAHKHSLKDPAIKIMPLIVRGADTDRHDLASQSSGLWTISAGLSYNIKNDLELLAQGMVIYDSLYSWAKYFSPAHSHSNRTLSLKASILVAFKFS